MDMNLQYDSQKGEIDNLVKEIVVGLEKCDPIRVLQIAANVEMQRNLHISSESELIDNDGIVRYVEYIQSVFVSSGFILEKNLTTDEEYISTILVKIGELYKKSKEFINFWSKKDSVSNKYTDSEIDYISESYLMSFVRGYRYQFQQFNYLPTLLQPHSDEFRKIFGITADEILEGLKKLENALSSGLFNAYKELGDYLKGHDSYDDSKFEEFISEIQNQTNHPLWNTANKALGVALYDVGSITWWPAKFIDSLSFKIGEAKGFLENKEFLGWPILDLPTQKKPFIKIDGVSYCFNYYVLFDNIYRTLQKTIKENDSGYTDNWSKLQQAASERIVADLFKKLLPKAKVYIGNYYNSESKKQFEENDITVIYDKCVLIIEVKAGSFTYTPSLTDFQSHKKSLETLIVKAEHQCVRTLNYIKLNEKAVFFDTNNKKKAKTKFSISEDSFDYIFTFFVTVDNFNFVEAKIEKNKLFSIDSGIIAISLDDLDFYANYFKSPLTFLHYLTHRQATTKVKQLYFNDELDHLGLYIKYNMYEKHILELYPDKKIAVVETREYFNNYYATRYNKDLQIKKPEQIIPSYIKQIIIFLDNHKMPNKVRLSNFLLDMDEYNQRTFNDFIDCAIRIERLNKRVEPFYLSCDPPICCYVIIPNVECRSLDEIKRHAYCVLQREKQNQGWQIILRLDDSKKITDVSFMELSLKNGE